MLFQANQHPPPLYWIFDLGSGEFLSRQDDPLCQPQNGSGAQKKPLLDRQIHPAIDQDDKTETRQDLSLAARRDLLHQVCLQIPPELRDQIVVLAAQALPPSPKPCWTGMLELSADANTPAFGPVVETLKAQSCLSLPIARVDAVAESQGWNSWSWLTIDTWVWRTSSLVPRLSLCRSIELLCATVLPTPGRKGHAPMTQTLDFLTTVPRPCKIDISVVLDFEGADADCGPRAEFCKLVDHVRGLVGGRERTELFVRAARIQAGVLTRWPRVKVRADRPQRSGELISEAAGLMDEDRREVECTCSYRTGLGLKCANPQVAEGSLDLDLHLA